MKGIWALTVGGLALAGVVGALTAVAIAQTGGGEAETTTTVNVGTGEQGEQGPPGPAGADGAPGPAGPAGPAGPIDCGPGFVIGVLVINHPGVRSPPKPASQSSDDSRLVRDRSCCRWRRGGPTTYWPGTTSWTALAAG